MQRPFFFFCALPCQAVVVSRAGRRTSAYFTATNLKHTGAPTLSFRPVGMSWPVAGTLMVEPTESETKAEIDRFILALLSIREEIRAIEAGEIDRDNNPLKHAPHTADSLLGSEWGRPYSREVGAGQAQRVPGSVKYWPQVGRVDNVYGDRNLFCSCIPVGDYAA
jgi:glycine dehydrogenase